MKSSVIDYRFVAPPRGYLVPPPLPLGATREGARPRRIAGAHSG
jgi:hypothetical protein